MNYIMNSDSKSLLKIISKPRAWLIVNLKQVLLQNIFKGYKKLSVKSVTFFPQMNVVIEIICRQMFNIKYPSYLRINNIWSQ